MKLIDYIKKKIALRRERKAKELFQSVFRAAYPAAFDFIDKLRRVDVDGCSMPCFLLHSDFVAMGFVTACNSAGSIVRDIVAREIDAALKERSHSLDVSDIRIDGVHEDGDFILQIRFRELPGINQG